MKKITNKKGEVKWTKPALQYLLEKYQTTQLRHIARKIGAHPRILRLKLLEMGLQEAGNTFTPAQTQFLIDHYQKHSYTEIAKAIGKTFTEIKNQATKLGIKKTEKIYPREKRIPYKNKKYVQEHYYTKTYKQIAQDLNIPKQSVCNIVHILKSEGKITSKGRWTPTKGTKPFYIPNKPNKTSFKKGHQPHNTKKEGEIWKEPSSGLYYIKAEGKKQPLHRYLWQIAGNTIPPKHILIFKDKNKENCTIENLACISRAENVRRNANREKQSAGLKKAWSKAKNHILLGREITDEVPFAKNLQKEKPQVKARNTSTYLTEIDFNFS